MEAIMERRAKKRVDVKGVRPKKEAMIRARIEKDLKDEAETVFKELGLSTTQAITLFYNQVKLQRGLPFKLYVPNKDTLEAMREAKNRENLIVCESIEDAFAYLGI